MYPTPNHFLIVELLSNFLRLQQYYSSIHCLQVSALFPGTMVFLQFYALLLTIYVLCKMDLATITCVGAMASTYPSQDPSHREGL